MANNTKNTKKKVAAETTAATTVESVKAVKEEPKSVVGSETKEEVKTTPVMSQEEMMDIIKNLAAQVEYLKNASNAVPVTQSSETEHIDKLVAAITNRKSDKEVAIVHNQELTGGLKTHIELSNLTIDFGKFGEQRLLNWSQFEECVSKYRSFFDRQIILVAAEYKADADKYGVPCAKRIDGKHSLTREELHNICNLSAIELDAFMQTLSDEDVQMVGSYWLGKCYDREKDPRFYDRYKLDVLNRITKGSFTNIIVVKNEEEVRALDK